MTVSRYPYATPVNLTKVLPIRGENPEDVIVDRLGNVYCGVENGDILKISHDRGEVSIVANTGGRPLGLDWLTDDHLVICDIERGLLTVKITTGMVGMLADSVNGKKFKICNNPCVSKSGDIYFSDSSQRYTLADIRRDIIDNIPTGRLLKRGKSGEIEVLMEGLYFANGVVLAEDESFVLVAETGARQIQKYWLKGPLTGTSELFAVDMPGMPDNMSLGSDGLFWVALPSATDIRLELIHKHLPYFIRHALGRIPEQLQPPEKKSVLVMGFDQNGRCIHFIEANPMKFGLVTGVREFQGQLYLGSITAKGIGVIPVPAQHNS